ncbi:unnamed protein product [Camellia sinensis]
MEFATGGLGFSLQWWDQRKPGGPASQFKGNWAHGTTSGILHSIDIHPSRKHTCIAGGSSATVFAWDLLWQQQPIVLSGVAAGEFQSHSLSESEIWEVQYDSYSSNIGNMSTSRVLPVMICSEDGILAVVEQGEEPIELLAEPCAINSFDIDRQNPSCIVKSESDDQLGAKRSSTSLFWEDEPGSFSVFCTLLRTKCKLQLQLTMALPQLIAFNYIRKVYIFV